MYYMHYTDCTTVCIDGTDHLHQGCAGPRRTSANLCVRQMNLTSVRHAWHTQPLAASFGNVSVCVYAYGTCVLVSEQRFVRHMCVRVNVYICLCVWQCECKHAHVCVRKMK